MTVLGYALQLGALGVMLVFCIGGVAMNCWRYEEESRADDLAKRRRINAAQLSQGTR